MLIGEARQLMTIPAFCRDGVLADNAERREDGRQHMSAVMIHWIAQNRWSHPILEELATWALQEEGALHTSQISHIRNGRMRMLGVKTVDALGAINLALWAYQQGDRPLLKVLGTAPLSPRIEELLVDAVPLIDPRSEAPLSQGGFMELYLGYVHIPGVIGGGSSATDLASLAEKLGPYLEAVIRASGVDFIEARQAFAKALGDEAKAKKLVAAAAGLDTLSAEELSTQVQAICAGLERIDGKARTPEELAQELAG